MVHWDGNAISRKRWITKDGGYKIGFAWSPDGQKLQYYMLGKGLYSIDLLSGKRTWILRE